MTRIGFVSSFPPTRCGLATFVDNLAAAMIGPRDTGFVIRALDAPEVDGGVTTRSGIPVAHQLIANRPDTVAEAARLLNGADVAVIQHEYGIYGGPDGSDVVELIDALRVPVVVTLHTVLPEPTPGQRRALDRVIAAASSVVVMTEGARDRLIAVHDVPPRRVHVIPHGVTALAADASATRTADAMAGEAVPGPHVLTWGLIGPGKGIEWAILAMALLADMDAPPHYRVLGQTHPKVFARDGDSYRDSLLGLAHELGVADRVHLDSRYQDHDTLVRHVTAASVVVLPYDSTSQATSGVLAEAVAAGKPVVATAFPHAVELLTDGPGIIVPHAQPHAIAKAIRAILTRPDTADKMVAAASRASAGTTWADVGARYRRLAHAATATVAA